MFGIVLAIVAILAFPIIFLMQRRLKTHGALFTGPATPLMRVIALLVGILFGALFIMDVASGSIHYLWPILSLALLAYALGASRWLNVLQGAQAVKVGTTEIQMIGEGARVSERRKIRGIEGMSATELNLELQKGGKFVVFQRCISALVVTYRSSSDIYFIRAGEGTFSKSIGHTLVALFFGWWALPGPIQTIGALATNLRGGLDVTKEVIAALNQPAHSK